MEPILNDDPGDETDFIPEDDEELDLVAMFSFLIALDD